MLLYLKFLIFNFKCKNTNKYNSINKSSLGSYIILKNINGSTDQKVWELLDRGNLVTPAFNGGKGHIPSSLLLSHSPKICISIPFNFISNVNPKQSIRDTKHLGTGVLNRYEAVKISLQIYIHYLMLLLLNLLSFKYYHLRTMLVLIWITDFALVIIFQWCYLF